ncbi:MAG: hypothetical protein ACOX3G_12200 [Armatimonadota bacterium]|jgi:hypothetical protein
MEHLNWVLIGVAIPIIILLVIRTRKRAKALDERIEQYKAEQEQAKANGTYNPYQDFIELFNKQQPKGRKR